MVNTSSKQRWGLWIVLVVVTAIALIVSLVVIAKQISYNPSNNSNNLEAMSTSINGEAMPSGGGSGTTAGTDKNDPAEADSKADVKERMLTMTIHAEPCEMSEGSLDRGFVRYENLPADLRDTAYPPSGHIRVQKGDTAADQIYAVEVDSQNDGRPEYVVVMECSLGAVAWPQQLIVLDEDLNQTDFVSGEHYPSDAEMARVGLRDLQTRGDKVYMMWGCPAQQRPCLLPDRSRRGNLDNH